MMMSGNMERGPSPLVPSLFLLVLGMLIYWTSLLSIFDMLLSFSQMVAEAEEKSFTALILVLLVLLVFVFIYFPSSFLFGKSSSYGTNRHVHDHDEFGSGLGTLLLVLLFILLYNLIWDWDHTIKVQILGWCMPSLYKNLSLYCCK